MKAPTRPLSKKHAVEELLGCVHLARLYAINPALAPFANVSCSCQLYFMGG
jgi:hypothetical protein